MNYLVISPVKDEEKYVEHTLRSMVGQTVKPVRWVIVDDGSCDRTPEIVESFAARYDFIQFVRSSHRGVRQPGSAVIQAFNRGYESVRDKISHDFVVKLDCDLSFGPDYFAELISAFSKDPRLGIASGVYLESGDGKEWVEIEMPSYHAAGCSKVMLRHCFDEIGGFVASRGWDTVDEIRALARGWRTGHFSNLRMRHWKREGAGIGALRTNVMHGEIYYLTGGSMLFFLLKILHRIWRRPFLIGGLALLWGYARLVLRCENRLVTPAEARCYRGLLTSRMATGLKALKQTAGASFSR